jgi:hypothetical protein
MFYNLELILILTLVYIAQIYNPGWFQSNFKSTQINQIEKHLLKTVTLSIQKYKVICLYR